jgi:hypothetical protein
MQAIQTRYLAPTNTLGARIKAWAQAGSITIPYPHELSGQAVHRLAALSLADKYGWEDQYLGGQLPNGDYVFVADHNLSRE